MTVSEYKVYIEFAKNLKYSALNYLGYDNLKNATVLMHQSDALVLKEQKEFITLYHWAVNSIEQLLSYLHSFSPPYQLNFVPSQFVAPLKEKGLDIYAEFTDYVNESLATVAISPKQTEEFLSKEDVSEVHLQSVACRDISRGFTEDSEEFLLSWMNEGAILVYRENNVLCGYCCLKINPNRTSLWLREVLVFPQYQGKGIGSKLLEQAINYAVVRGVNSAILTVDIENKTAINLYEKYGFYRDDDDSEIQMIQRNIL